MTNEGLSLVGAILSNMASNGVGEADVCRVVFRKKARHDHGKQCSWNDFVEAAGEVFYKTLTDVLDITVFGDSWMLTYDFCEDGYYSKWTFHSMLGAYDTVKPSTREIEECIWSPYVLSSDNESGGGA